jgi:hypothetical protein
MDSERSSPGPERLRIRRDSMAVPDPARVTPEARERLRGAHDAAPGDTDP